MRNFSPVLKKLLTREFRAWHPCHALNSRVSTFFNCGAERSKVSQSIRCKCDWPRPTASTSAGQKVLKGRLTHVRNGFFASLRTYEHSRNDGSDQIRNEQILMSRVGGNLPCSMDSKLITPLCIFACNLVRAVVSTVLVCAETCEKTVPNVRQSSR